MGGVFSSPKTVTVPVVDNSAEKAAAEAKARQEALDRQRRGMESTIRTSYNGILKENSGYTRKKLLGE